MDIVNFIENILGHQLLDCDKEFVLKAYESEKTGNNRVYIKTCGNDEYMLRVLYALVVIYHAQEIGIIDKRE